MSELDPDKSGTLTVDLKAGKYLLICNVPGHYGAGMWAEFTVEP
ncbi:sulfocyanin-like copper-binding protein [Mesorhizobium sp. M7A.F.Ca.US.008.03.1.1]|nr:sulfocyanin-like copper-binding protein [Mesorhizobium sp. M7A.F.Ca.US.008.03.1.1]